MATKVMIVTGEASGDLHGAGVIRALRRRINDLQVSGMGGAELASCGVEILCDAERVSVVGVFEVFSRLGDILSAQRILRRRLKADPPDLLILIDLPDFNLLLAKFAKKIGIPVFYYITPQVWAWRSGRVKTIRERVDQLAVILPFEEAYFQERGVAARYVGHPLLDSVRPRITPAQFRQIHQIPATTEIIGLLPGSRRREVATLLPVMIAAAEEMQRGISTPLLFCIPRATTISREFLDQFCQIPPGTIDILVIDDHRYSLMAACRAVVAASGTVTLELAILGVPMVVVYRLSLLSYLLGRMLIKLDHFSLVNLIAGFRAVPELLQDEVKPLAICQAVSELFNEGERRAATLDALALVRERLGESGAAERVAEMVLLLLAATREEEAREADEVEPVLIAPGPVLDLHHFSPKELGTLVPDFLLECQENGIFEVRIIHGKGSGQLRRSVHALLERNPRVARFRSAAPQNGDWGATEILLKGPSAPEEEDLIEQ